MEAKLLGFISPCASGETVHIRQIIPRPSS